MIKPRSPSSSPASGAEDDDSSTKWMSALQDPPGVPEMDRMSYDVVSEPRQTSCKTPYIDLIAALLEPGENLEHQTSIVSVSRVACPGVYLGFYRVFDEPLYGTSKSGKWQPLILPHWSPPRRPPSFAEISEYSVGLAPVQGLKHQLLNLGVASLHRSFLRSTKRTSVEYRGVPFVSEPGDRLSSSGQWSFRGTRPATLAARQDSRVPSNITSRPERLRPADPHSYLKHSTVPRVATLARLLVYYATHVSVWLLKCKSPPRTENRRARAVVGSLTGRRIELVRLRLRFRYSVCDCDSQPTRSPLHASSTPPAQPRKINRPPRDPIFAPPLRVPAGQQPAVVGVANGPSTPWLLRVTFVPTSCEMRVVWWSVAGPCAVHMRSGAGWNSNEGHCNSRRSWGGSQKRLRKISREFRPDPWSLEAAGQLDRPVEEDDMTRLLLPSYEILGDLEPGCHRTSSIQNIVHAYRLDPRNHLGFQEIGMTKFTHSSLVAPTPFTIRVGHRFTLPPENFGIAAIACMYATHISDQPD
ncbi:hypothetical protein K438DRAFT_1749249 [Mycena galopus ATCC 62051]|nr:hypothetical protein K438DRAFT_1749249 [Mycena galopus ATCC 62051]